MFVRVERTTPLETQGQTTHLAKVIIIEDDARNRNKWKIGIVEDLISGRDDVVRAAKLRAGKEHSNGRYSTSTYWSCPATEDDIQLAELSACIPLYNRVRLDYIFN